MLSEIIALRKELHQYPELSGQELNTAKRVKDFIEKHFATEIIENVGGNGLMAIYEYSKTGKTVVIRCELDALPITEINTFEHQSKIRGVSHKCGHDGHIAMVAGLIFWIKKQTFTSGKIVLLFQPAEETGKGGFEVMNDERFLSLNVDYMFALHNIPGVLQHQIITIKKGFSAEVQSLAIRLKGKEAHASEPENGNNPAFAIAALIQEIAALNVNEPTADNFAILTPIYINLGEKSYGISPAKGELHYTIRTWNGTIMQHLKNEISCLVARKSETYGLSYKMDWFEYFPASSNDDGCNNLIAKVAKINGFECVERPYPFRFGEDFGWFSKQYQTAMFGLGAGLNSPALHHADYDFPDVVIETGIKMFAGLIENILLK